MDSGTLLAELAPTAERLLERHLATSKEWLPQPAPPAPTGAAVHPDVSVALGVRSALILNVLTEDALPYFTTGLYLRFGGAAPWWDWIRRWTAEETRHGLALHHYLSLSGVVDAADLERRRLHYLSTATVPSAPGVAEACVYLALQELATRTAHANTARLLPDEAGRQLVARIAGDEHLHHLFYRDLVAAALELSPSSTIPAIDYQVRHFTMPGRDIPEFSSLASAVADAGIYSSQVYLGHVVMPLVIGAWHIDGLTRVAPPARQARDRLLAFIERMQSIVPRLRGATSAAPVDAAARRDSS